MNDQDNKKENVTIKGISKEIYEEIKKIAKETGRTIGELTDEAYNTFLLTLDDITKASNNFINSLKDGSTKIIENIDELEITGKELKSFSRKIIFRNIGRLTLREIEENDIRNYIVSIQNIRLVQIPKEVSKLIILERGKFIGKIETL